VQHCFLLIDCLLRMQVLLFSPTQKNWSLACPCQGGSSQAEGLLPRGAMQEVRKLVEFLVPLASAEELRFTEADLKANRFGLEV